MYHVRRGKGQATDGTQAALALITFAEHPKVKRTIEQAYEDSHSAKLVSVHRRVAGDRGLLTKHMEVSFWVIASSSELYVFLVSVYTFLIETTFSQQVMTP